MINLKVDNRKIIRIYDPVLCCPTGICGVNVDPELIRMALVTQNLKKRDDVFLERYNLKDNPRVYVETVIVNKTLVEEGSNALPITIIDGKVVSKSKYPSNHQFAEWLGIDESELINKG